MKRHTIRWDHCSCGASDRPSWVIRDHHGQPVACTTLWRSALRIANERARAIA